MDNQPAASTPEASPKSTGPLPSSSGSLASGAMRRLGSRDFVLRLCEFAIFLTAIVGAVALGLGITAYFRDHLYVAAYLLAYGGFRLAEVLIREDDASGSGLDAFVARITNEVPILVLFAAAPFERTYVYRGEAPAWAAALGLLLELSGLWLALGARIQLEYFSEDPAGRQSRLVRGGFYRYLRHPVYAGGFLVLFAWPFEYGAPVTAVIVLILGAFVVYRRIRAEEAALVARFGDQYEAYRKETDALIPSVW